MIYSDLRLGRDVQRAHAFIQQAEYGEHYQRLISIVQVKHLDFGKWLELSIVHRYQRVVDGEFELRWVDGVHHPLSMSVVIVFADSALFRNAVSLAHAAGLTNLLAFSRCMCCLGFLLGLGGCVFGRYLK